MATHRYDPYLWVHLAGIATVPLWLAICGLGLAVGSPQWPGVELALLTLLGVSPVLWMQLGRPFYIFSLLVLTLKPTALSDDQRRLLTLFQQWWVRGLAVTAPVPLVWLLWEIYPRAVVASDITPFAPWGRLGGLAVATGSFAMANLFLQVPVSVLAVMATSDKRFKRTTPYSLEAIKTHFTQVGIPLNRLLPEVLPPDGAVSASQESIAQDSMAQAALAQDAMVQDSVPRNQDVTEVEPADSGAKITLNLPQGIAPETTIEDVQGQAEVLQYQADYPDLLVQQDVVAQQVEVDSQPVIAEAAIEASIEAESTDVDVEVVDHIPLNAGDEGEVFEGQEELGAEIEASETTVEVLEGVAEDWVSESENLVSGSESVLEDSVSGSEDAMEDSVSEVSESQDVEEDSVSESHDVEVWDHGSEGWDQTTRDWDQDTDWEVSAESAKETTVEVAVVRISDPS